MEVGNSFTVGRGRSLVKSTAADVTHHDASAIGSLDTGTCYEPPATNRWNRGLLRSGSKLGSILSQLGER